MFEHMMEITNESIAKVSDEFPYNALPNLGAIVAKKQKVLALLTETGFGEIVFCHNDINQKNVIWHPNNRTLCFLDLEMTMNNYATLEIGQTFFCSTGHFLYDLNGNFFPNTDYRKRFLRAYLNEKNRLNKFEMNEVSFEEELLKLYQVNLAALFFTIQFILMTQFFDCKYFC